MTQEKKNGKIIAIITMIFLFGMISFVTNLAAPMGIVLKNQFDVSNALGMLGNFGNFIAYAVMGIPSGILLQRVGYKKTALIAVAIGFVGVGIQFLSGHSSPEMAFAVYLIGAFVAGFSMCLLNTVVNPMLNKLGGEGNKGNQLIQVGGSFNSVMATYAPLFAHVEGWQWRPDMIWFDNLNSVRTVSYYVQQLYAQNKGTNVLPLTMNKKSVTGAEGQNGLFASAVYDKDKNELIVKVANTSNTAQSISLNFAGLKKQDVLSNGRCIKLRSLDLDKDNTLEQPFAITPQETAVSVEGHVFTTEQEPNTFAVYKFTKK